MEEISEGLTPEQLREGLQHWLVSQFEPAAIDALNDLHRRPAERATPHSGED